MNTGHTFNSQELQLHLLHTEGEASDLLTLSFISKAAS